MAVSEEQLKEIITSLLNECKTKGSIGSDALCDRLEKYDADPSQIDEIYRSLEVFPRISTSRFGKSFSVIIPALTASSIS